MARAGASVARLREGIGVAGEVTVQREQPRPQRVLEVALAPRAEPDLVVELLERAIDRALAHAGRERTVEHRRRLTIEPLPYDPTHVKQHDTEHETGGDAENRRPVGVAGEAIA